MAFHSTTTVFVLSLLASACPATAQRTLLIGSGETAWVLDARTGSSRSVHLAGHEVAVSGEEFRLNINGQTLTFADFHVESPRREGMAWRVPLQHPLLDVDLLYTPTALGGIRKRMILHAKRAITLDVIDIESIRFERGVRIEIAPGPAIPHSVGNLPICAFIEAGRAGGFLSLDFPYSDATQENGALRIGYRPHEQLMPGVPYESLAVTLMSYRLTKREFSAWDAAASAAFRRYLRFDYARPHWNAPQLIYTSIVNRYTEVDAAAPQTPLTRDPIQNTIFYTLSDANYLMLRPEKVPEEIDFCKTLSMDWCQLYEGPFEWIAGRPTAGVLDAIGRYARDRGVRLGLYTGANQLTAPHFNHYGQDKGKPEWKMLDAAGKRGPYCWGAKAFANWFADTLIHASLNFGFRQANFDFLTIAPCYDVSHGHAAGDEGIFQQVRNLVEVLDRIRASVPGYTYDSNLGWPPFVPKMARSMDAFYLNDPHFLVFFPGLNSNETLDNSRRYEMVSYFLDYLTPVEYFRNCEYFVSADSVLHDSQILEYGILQGLAVSPNLQLGEFRALFDRLNSADRERATRFLARWTAFVTDNFEYYSDTRVLSGKPALGKIEVYSHTYGDRAYVFAVNPNPFPLQASFTPGPELGLEGTGPYEIRELYPEEKLLTGSQVVEVRREEVFSTVVPSRTVQVFALGPMPRYTHAPLRIAGIPAYYDRFPDHYRIHLEAWQGEKRAVQLFFPADERLERVVLDKRELTTTENGPATVVALQFPKEKVESDIGQWSVRAGSAEENLRAKLSDADGNARTIALPQIASAAPAANFLGARVENLLNEKFPLELDVYFQPRSSAPSRPTILPRNEDKIQAHAEFPMEGREWWYEAHFNVAFVQRFVPPGPEQHNYIPLNFREPSRVAEIRAWLNGVEARVERFHAWRAPDSAFTFYIDGTRAGLRRNANTLALHVRYQENAGR